MKPTSSHSSAAERTLIRGIHLELTEALKNTTEEKAARLFRHQERIIRLRVDLEHDRTADITRRFIAKGHIEISGPDLVASVSSDDAYKSVDLLIDKLDSLLRRRHGYFKGKRHNLHEVDLPVDLPKAR